MRRALLAVVLALGVTVLMPSSPAQALYPCPADSMCLHTWYADTARTIWRGSYSINCEGTPLRLGQNNGYLTYSVRPCGDTPPPPVS